MGEWILSDSIFRMVSVLLKNHIFIVSLSQSTSLANFNIANNRFENDITEVSKYTAGVSVSQRSRSLSLDIKTSPELHLDFTARVGTGV